MTAPAPTLAPGRVHDGMASARELLDEYDAARAGGPGYSPTRDLVVRTLARALRTATPAAPVAPVVADRATAEAVDAFVGDVLDLMWASGGDVDGGDLQDVAESRGIIAKIECGGMDGGCPICEETDSDYHYSRVLYAGVRHSAAPATADSDAGEVVRDD